MQRDISFNQRHLFFFCVSGWQTPSIAVLKMQHLNTKKSLLMVKISISKIVYHVAVSTNTIYFTTRCIKSITSYMHIEQHSFNVCMGLFTSDIDIVQCYVHIGLEFIWLRGLSCKICIETIIVQIRDLFSTLSTSTKKIKVPFQNGVNRSFRAGHTVKNS